MRVPVKIQFALWLLFVALQGVSQPATLPGKQIVFSRLPENLGLSQSSVNDILQDKEGYLWVATWSGLIRYDGYSVEVFHSGNGDFDLKSNLISCVFEDHEGILWVGTHISGLFRYDKRTGKFHNYRHDPSNSASISNNNIWKIIEDDAHNLWIATEEGLNFFSKSTDVFTRFKNESNNSNSLSANFVTDLLISEDKSIWIATNYGLNHLVKNGEGIKIERYADASSDNAHNFVYRVAEVRKGDTPEIWFITKKGLKLLKAGKIVNYLAEDKPSNFSLFRSILVIESEKSSILLGSAMGISFFDPGQKIFQNHISNLDAFKNDEGQSMAVTALYLDRGGVLWVGTKKGLYKCDSYKNDFDLFLTSSFDVTNSIITGIRPSSRGYWVSTIGGGLFNLHNRRFQPFPVRVSEKNDFAPFIQSLFTDSRGNVWLGTAGAGVIVFNSEDALKSGKVRVLRHYHATSDPAMRDDYIVSFAEDNDGVVWIGTWNGNLVGVHPDGKIRELPQELFDHFPVVSLYADKSGSVWVGTRGNGIFRLRFANGEPALKHYHDIPQDSTSLVSDFINAIYEDQSGGMWIGTEGGLVFLDRRSEKFRLYEIKDGPANKVIVGILEDESRKLWLSHWNGITMIDPEDTTLQRVKHFDTHDLIQGGFFYNNVCLKDSEGNLLFGGSNGLNIIRPEKLVQNPLRPNVIISEFRLFNETVIPGKKINDRLILDHPLQESTSIRLRHAENTISFTFAALDFAAPEKIRYAYTLDGFDASWNFTDASRRFANYTNLREGDYTFRVMSTNNDGEWNSAVREIRISILPPWWKTTWAFALYFALTMILLFTFRKLVLMRANFKHDLKVERLQRENIELLNQAKLQFFTNISHEFRTPLTLILGPVHQLLETSSGEKFMRTQLHTINNNAQRLLRLVNQLLDFRKAETGNLRLRVSEGNLVNFVREIKLSFDGLARERRISFEFQSSSEMIRVYFDRDQFEKILFNLLSNAFKHTPEGGRITVRLEEQPGKVVLYVEDSGDGIKPEHFDQIFQTFFSYDGDRHHSGTGIGLALVKTLVDAHHGTIEVRSKEKEHTVFSISVLPGSAHFDAGVISDDQTDDEGIGQCADPSFGEFPPMDSRVEEDDASVERPKLLVVEDNNEVRSYVRSIFHPRFAVLEAEHGKEGLLLALQEIPDMIISDVMMPEMDGIALCTELKSNIKTSHIPVILLTARTSLIFKVEGLETGADDYMTKPFSPQVLRLKVRNMLRSREAMRKMFREPEVLQIEPKKVTLNKGDETFIRKVLECIENHIGSADFSVEVLCEDVAMSRTQLYRKLKALTGQSANEFIRSIRLKRAAQLLLQRELTVAEVTFEVGFNDLQYFRECFKRMFGVTPHEYAHQTSGTLEAERSDTSKAEHRG